MYYIGEQFGNYRLLRLLGEGGFAHVYLGEHIHLKTQAAVKVLMTTLSKDEIIQFRNEARLMMEMDHPHIIRVLDFGLQGHVPFLVMTYAPGGSLRTRHPKGSQLSVPTVVEYIQQIASALQYIHDRKLIHRDIKPENMLITQNGAITLSDFGIAVSAHSERSLRQQNIGGTGIYMAPELFEGKPRTASDQYALAIVAYEWLTGAPPFQGSLAQLAYQHAVSQPRSLREQIPVSRSLDRVILQALAKDPLARFSHVQEFARTLEAATHAGSTHLAGQRPSVLTGHEYPTPSVLVDDQQPSSRGYVRKGPVSPSPIAQRQSLPPTKLATPFSQGRISSVSPPTYQPFTSSLPLPRTKKLWFLPVIFIMCAFLVIGGAVLGIGDILSTLSLQTSGSISGGNSTTVSTFLKDVMQQDYNQAYNYLDPSLLLVMTEPDFARQAQADDHCYGPVIQYAEVANSERTQNGAQSMSYTLTRGKRSYTLSFTLQKDSGSGNWLISQYGGQNDLGPSPPNC